MSAIQLLLNDYCLVSQQIAKFKASLRIYVSPKPQPPHLQYIEGSQGDFSVKLLNSDEVLHGPTLLYQLLTDYIVYKKFEYTSHSANNIAIYRSAFSFDNREDGE